MNAERRQRMAEMREAGRQAFADGHDRNAVPAGLTGNEVDHWAMGWWEAFRETNPD